MINALEKYNLECQEIFLEFKNLLFMQTLITEDKKGLSHENVEAFNSLCEKIQSDLLEKMNNYPTKSHHILSMYARQYTAQFILLADLTSPL